jgi:hypothetical protein
VKPSKLVVNFKNQINDKEHEALMWVMIDTKNSIGAAFQALEFSFLSSEIGLDIIWDQLPNLKSLTIKPISSLFGQMPMYESYCKLFQKTNFSFTCEFPKEFIEHNHKSENFFKINTFTQLNPNHVFHHPKTAEKGPSFGFRKTEPTTWANLIQERKATV